MVPVDPPRGAPARVGHGSRRGGRGPPASAGADAGQGRARAGASPATRSSRRQGVVVVEAMKMENELRAGRSGRGARGARRRRRVGGCRHAAGRDRMSEQTPPETPEPEPAAEPGRHARGAPAPIGLAAARPAGPPRCFMFAAILLAVAFVTTLTIDLGPGVRGMAERAGGNYLKRDFTIGRLSIRLLTGRFVVEDLRIGGLEKGHRPFLVAKSIEVLDGFQRAGPSRGAGRVGADDRLEDGRGDVAERPAQLPEVHARAHEPPGPEALRDHGAIGGGRRAASSISRITACRGAPSRAISRSPSARPPATAARRSSATAPSPSSSTCRCRRTWTASSASTARS